MSNKNMVNHPSHYADGRKYEPSDVIDDWGLNFNLGNTVKYISRAGRKNDLLEDLQKAKWYLEKEISNLGGDMNFSCPKVENKSTSTGKIGEPLPEPIDYATMLMKLLEKDYQDRDIDLLDMGMEIYDNDLRKIANHILVEIGDLKA